MSSTLPSDSCPYKGLRPYTENDSALFFGRTRDAQIIISNLYAAPLTIFYGASGVGKSSVLLAGTVPLLEQEPNVSVIVFRFWQNPGFAEQLKLNTREILSGNTGKPVEVDLSLPLDEFLSQAGRGLRGPLFFIFDQFEEYFLYHPTDSASDVFEAEFAAAVNRRDLNANFLISIREDSLSKLDRFQGRIPALMQNMLRLEHLDVEGAKDAIIRPLEEYSRQADSGQSITIEPALVNEILEDLLGAKVTPEQTARGRVEDIKPAAGIETPLLQMVMTRLWDEERAQDSKMLRRQTFETLGRAKNIARTHLDTMMMKLSSSERDDAAEILRYLVTPSGTKIAQEAGALASWTELKEPLVQSILNRLSNQDMRILRSVQAPGQPLHYEIFHDVLAQAILNWRRRFVARREEERIRREEQERLKQEQSENERRLKSERARRVRIAIVALLIIVSIWAAVMTYAFWQRSRARQARRQLRALEGQIEQRRLDLEKAQKDLSLAREVADHMRQGQLYNQQRDYDDAVKEFDQVLAIDPKNPNAYNQKGYAYLRKGEYPEAEKNLIQSIELDPSFVWGHYNLALAYWAVGKPNEAVKEVEAVLRLRPDFRKTIKNDGQFRKFNASPEYIKLMESSDSQ